MVAKFSWASSLGDLRLAGDERLAGEFGRGLRLVDCARASGRVDPRDNSPVNHVALMRHDLDDDPPGTFVGMYSSNRIDPAVGADGVRQARPRLRAVSRPRNLLLPRLRATADAITAYRGIFMCHPLINPRLRCWSGPALLVCARQATRFERLLQFGITEFELRALAAQELPGLAQERPWSGARHSPCSRS